MVDEIGGLQLPTGHPSGPDATLAAGAAALVAAESAHTVVLVEGISDQIALETLARRTERDLEAEGVVVVPVGGASAFTPFLQRFGPSGAGLVIRGMCDAGEEEHVRRALAGAGIGTPHTRAAMAQLGFSVCVQDLEDELIRAAGRPAIEELLEKTGDLSSFRTLQKQPPWRHEPFASQLRRFVGAGARRKLRFAELMVESIPMDRVPRPMAAALASA